jgi:transposase-like protein
MRELGISSATVVEWSSYCRDICLNWALKETSRLGGPGKIVEIDEAKFGKDRTVNGVLIKKGQWVFGGIERGSKKCFYIPVENRDAATLMPLIHQWIRPETTIISDCWKAYNKLNKEGYKHLTVNHKYYFVDPNTYAHTNNIERSWRDARRSVPQYGRKREHMAGYFAEFLFKRFHENIEDRLHHFLKAVSEVTF